jgi:hypothetical protein
MVEQRQVPRRGSLLGGVRSTSEDHRATPFELFVDDGGDDEACLGHPRTVLVW